MDIPRLANIGNGKRVPSRIRKGVIKWARNYTKYPDLVGGRFYHIFHQVPHELRPYLLFNGSPLTEAFDLHNAFYTLMLFKLKGQVSDAEYQKYRALVKTGRFYEDVQQKTGIVTRQKTKDFLQRYRNITIAQAQAKAHNEPEFGHIDQYFEQEFPEIRRWLNAYPREDGTKKLQADMCWVELFIFNPICRMLYEKYGVTPFSLHDGIYLSEYESNLIADKVDWNQIEDEYIWSKV